jgi:DNA repair protein RadC
MKEEKSDGSPEVRLVEQGWSGLSEVDLLTLLLAPGNSPDQARRTALRLHECRDGIRSFKSHSYASLREAGVGHKWALSLLAAREIGRRAARRPLPPDRSFHSSAEVFSYFRPLLEGVGKECFWAVLMDGKNRIIRLARISEGCLTRSLVHPREVFRPAIMEAAAGVLFVHNHPSGLPDPSQEDIHITRRLVETGKVVGIRVLDHVIIGAYRYFSFADEGML